MEVSKLLRENYKDKKVFITGHTGFKGSWLTLWLESLGAEVKGYSLKPEADKILFKSIQNNLKCQSIFSDIRNFKKLESEILSFKPDYIFHLAAQPLVRKSYELPLYTIETNTLGTSNLLQSLVMLKKKCNVIIVTTDKVYENKESLKPYKENDRLGGYDLYSSSKACSEIITQSYIQSFFNLKDYKHHKKCISTARAGNVIGGGDYSEDRLIPDIVKALKNYKTIIVRNPKSVRPWQYVLEPLYGYLLLGYFMNIAPLKYSGSYNFGPNNMDVLDVESMVKLSIKYFESGNYKIKTNKNAPHESGILRLDISKVKKILNWKPLLKTNEALYETIKWYKKSSQRNSDIFALCLNHIKNYTQKIKLN